KTTRPKEIRRNLPEAAQDAILKALSFSASDRYTSALRFAEELARSLTGQPSSSGIDDQYSTEVKRGVTTTSGKIRVTTPENITQLSAALRHRRRSGLWLPVVTAAALLLAIGALIWKSGNRGPKPPPPPPPMTERLSYWMTVQKYRDGRPYPEPFKLAGAINFESDYHVRLHVSSRQSGFLYILNEGPAPAQDLPSYVLLFPSPTSNQSSAQLTANQRITIPELGDGFVFDREQG